MAQDYFEANGVYKMISSSDEYVFICTAASSTKIGKLVQYKTDTPRQPGALYEKTGVSYFLNCFYADDIKSLFLSRDNYELVGKIGNNYCLSDDMQYLYKD